MVFGIKRAQKIRDEMLAYMKKKYDADFIALSLTQRGLSDNKDVLICYAAGTDPKQDYVTVNRWGEVGQYTFDDTYFSVKIRPEIEAIFYGVCREMALESVVRYEGNVFFDESFDKNKTFADLALDRQCRYIDVTIIIKEPAGHNVQAVNDAFTEKIMLTPFKGTCIQYYLKQEYFYNLNEENVYEMLYEKNGYLAYRSRMVCM